MEQNATIFSGGTNPSMIAFDGRRVLVSASDATDTQYSVFAINPDRFDSTSGLYYNANNFMGASSGYNNPKGFVAVHDGPGAATAVYVVSTLGIHKAFDAVPLDVGNAIFRGGQIVATRTVTASATLKTSDYILRCDHSSPMSVALPTTARVGQTYIIKDVSSAGAAINNITISQVGGTIDGAAMFVITTNKVSVKVVYAGSNAWDVV
jgi:hypothetical protein